MTRQSVYRAFALLIVLSLLLALTGSALASPAPAATSPLALTAPAALDTPVLDPAGVARLRADANGNVSIGVPTATLTRRASPMNTTPVAQPTAAACTPIRVYPTTPSP